MKKGDDNGDDYHGGHGEDEVVAEYMMLMIMLMLALQLELSKSF